MMSREELSGHSAVS